MREEFIHIPGFESDLPFAVALAGISFCDGTYHIARRSSDVHCIEYILQGEGTVHVHGNIYHPRAGDVYFLHAGEDHDYASSAHDPWIKLWMNVSGPLVDALIDSYGLRPFTVFHCDAEAYLRRMHAVLSDMSCSSEQMMQRTSLIFHELMQYLCAHVPRPGGEHTDARIVKEYIDAHVYDELSMASIAACICKSEAQTIRLFKRAYHTTPYSYYMSIRIKKALTLLRSTTLSVKEIAYRLHFCDEHYFSTLIKQKTGKSPVMHQKEMCVNSRGE